MPGRLGWRRDVRWGLEEGRQEGLAEGRQEGAQELLQHLLAKRFGPLPDWALARLASATPEELDQFAEALLDAPGLESVFGR